MKFIAFSLMFALFAVTGEADVLKARGAAPRQHFAASGQPDVDDVIRAEDDPDFLQYLKERARQEKLNDLAAKEAAKARRAEEAAYEKARREYIAEESRKPATEYFKQQSEYLAEQKSYEREQEKYRREYVAEQERQERKAKTRRLARMQKAFGAERMPASE